MTKGQFINEFESWVDKYFGKLISEYGFKKVNVQDQRYEHWVDFENRTTHVSVRYEIGAVPWIVIGNVRNPDKYGSSLEWLLVELGIENMPSVEDAYKQKQHSKEEIESLLEKKGQQLFTYAVDLLQGNFKIVPKLQRRGKDFAEECEKYMASNSKKKKPNSR